MRFAARDARANKELGRGGERGFTEPALVRHRVARAWGADGTLRPKPGSGRRARPATRAGASSSTVRCTDALRSRGRRASSTAVGGGTFLPRPRREALCGSRDRPDRDPDRAGPQARPFDGLPGRTRRDASLPERVVRPHRCLPVFMSVDDLTGGVAEMTRGYRPDGRILVATLPPSTPGTTRQPGCRTPTGPSLRPSPMT